MNQTNSYSEQHLAMLACSSLDQSFDRVVRRKDNGDVLAMQYLILASSQLN